MSRHVWNESFILLGTWKELNYGYVLGIYKIQYVIFLLCLNVGEIYSVF